MPKRRSIYSYLDDFGISGFTTILEIGANDGSDSSKLAANAPNGHLHAFEPDERAIANFLKTDMPGNVTLHRHAIGAENGEVTFYPSLSRRDRDWDKSGSIRRPKKVLEKYPELSFGEGTTVPIRRLDDWARENGIEAVDLIWADVQGAEEDVIQGGRETLSRTRYFYTEFSNREMYEGQVRLEALLAMLPEFELIERYNSDVLLRHTKLT
ncbi:2-O-methyltransferase NoeI [Pseudoruegeria aquimaris]|uniref:2-O-methyltransferase NoeI n=1 Tax=Pseudoruegeria aquimaris TaxID=393663 RepID=A0A1Y5RHV6_9RHOB|nr:FkbM family methyltransferase [Pseudoruegeria aquimaris]SLN16892.1 2-O-methyltransferase NoeI [Pseudoruegeria aquimaris]